MDKYKIIYGNMEFLTENGADLVCVIHRVLETEEAYSDVAELQAETTSILIGGVDYVIPKMFKGEIRYGA